MRITLNILHKNDYLNSYSLNTIIISSSHHDESELGVEKHCDTLSINIITHRFVFEVPIGSSDEEGGESAGAHQPAQRICPFREYVSVVLGGCDVGQGVNKYCLWVEKP